MRILKVLNGISRISRHRVMHQNMIVVRRRIPMYYLRFECVDVLFIILLISSVKLERKINSINIVFFVSFMFLVPCFLISCMTLVGFLVAPDTGEKVTLRNN